MVLITSSFGIRTSFFYEFYICNNFENKERSSHPEIPDEKQPVFDPERWNYFFWQSIR